MEAKRSVIDSVLPSITAPQKKASEKILMFGEGNFLRAFVGAIVEKMNRSGGYSGSIVALQGQASGMAEKINAQEGAYTVIERGYENGHVVEESLLVNAISRCIDPFKNYFEYLALATDPKIGVIVSNTTEFGICYEKGVDRRNNYPAKLTEWLYSRYRYFNGDTSKGLLILPCELIDKNGDKLYQTVLQYASDFDFGDGFKDWLDQACNFCNTLVDRIVSGYPFGEETRICGQLGYTDSLLDVCEPFLLWVIESKKQLDGRFPASISGYNIVITDNMEFYRTRKVRILNGAHTASVLAGHLAGFDTVEQLVNDPLFSRYINALLYNEVIPLIQGDMVSYAATVMDRFKNPFLNHRLLSIALNSVSKFKARLWGSVADYVRLYKKTPHLMAFAMAALIAFYQQEIGKQAKEEARFVERLSQHFVQNGNDAAALVKAVLSDEALWDENLSDAIGFCETVTAHFEKITNKGVKAALTQALENI